MHCKGSAGIAPYGNVMIRTLIMIGDIHLGALPPEKQKKELELFFHDLQENWKSIDGVFLLGDTYDRKIYLNDPITDLAIWFYQKLISLAKKKGFLIRIIYGTKSHEAGQYNLIDQIPLDGVDLKVITQASVEEVFPKVRILYLPEEHVYSKQEYYKEFLYESDSPYQYVMGHGVIDDVMKVDDSEKKENTSRLHVPRFTTGELNACCSGQVFFGHYHVHTETDQRVFYVGSFSRWKFGEEEPKGYMISTYDCDNETYSYEFIENNVTDTYHTLYYGYDHSIFKSSKALLEEFDRLEMLIEKGVYQKIKCVSNIPECIDNPEFYVNAFKERFRFSKDIKIDFGHGYTERQRIVDKEAARKIYNEYGFIKDESLDFEVRTSTFIKKEKNKEISPCRIKKYMDCISIEELL